MPYVYVLRSEKNGRFYTGSTRTSPKNRLKYHNSGKVFSTRGHKPFKLVYSREFPTYREARKRELFFKTGAGRAELKNILRAR